MYTETFEGGQTMDWVDVEETSFPRLNWMAESFPSIASTTQSSDRVVDRRAVAHFLHVREILQAPGTKQTLGFLEVDNLAKSDSFR